VCVRLFLLFAVAACASVGAAAAGGSTHRIVRSFVAPRMPAIPAHPLRGRACPIPATFRSSLERAARDTGFQLAMLVAAAEVESKFEPNAHSRADARGLLQVLPSTAASMRLDPNDPESDVLAGARYLKLLLERYQSTDAALAAYNAGPTAVDRADGMTPSGATLTYVANVQLRWRALAGCR
jgi:soluble lytic murein transglycosylase-like protein